MPPQSQWNHSLIHSETITWSLKVIDDLRHHTVWAGQELGPGGKCTFIQGCKQLNCPTKFMACVSTLKSCPSLLKKHTGKPPWSYSGWAFLIHSGKVQTGDLCNNGAHNPFHYLNIFRKFWVLKLRTAIILNFKTCQMS